MRGKRSHCTIDIGLAILCSAEHRLLYGHTRTRSEIARYCGCTPERIRQIELRALRRVRFRLEQKLKEK